jgi:hypothetical protein
MQERHAPPKEEPPPPPPKRVEAPVPVTPVTPVTGPVKRSTKRPLVLGIGGAVLVAAGTGTLISAYGIQDEADAACPDPASEPCNRDLAQARNDSAVMRSRVGVGMIGAGVAVGAIAGYLWWRERRVERVGLTPTGGGAMVTFAGVWP